MKKLVLLAILLTATLSLTAAPVGKERAQRVARNAVSLLCAERHNLSPALPVELTDITATLGAERLHVFTYRQGDVQGFVVISGDDIASPLLAFSDEGEPDATLTHPAFLMHLQQYDRQIQAGQAAKANAPAHIRKKWKMLEACEVASLLPKGDFFNDNIPGLLGNMRWNQSAPYNTLCPGGSVTGCVATAYGMIMNYWDYPEHGFGYHSYNGADNPAAYPSWRYGTLSADFEHTYYDWNHMPDYIGLTSSDTAINAVSTLLYHLGVALDMRYTPSASGCWSLREYAIFDTSLHLQPTIGSEYRIPKHFGYRYDYAGMRDSIGDDTLWMHMLYNSLAAGKPIYYAGWAADTSAAGHSATSGHGYVVDGYFSDPVDSNYFHINWGWNGTYNGFFKLDAMRPNGSDFTQWHGAVIGLEPDTSYHGYNPAAIRPLVLDDASVSGHNGFVTVRNAQGRRIAIYDVTGRLVSGCTSHDSEWKLALRPGFYAVQIGSAPAKKVIVY